MRAADDVPARIGNLKPIEIDGVMWWRMRDVTDALRAPEKKGHLVSKEHKRKYYEYHRGFRSTISTLLNRDGVEQLVIKFCMVPRAKIMDALDRTAEARRSEEKQRR